MPQVFLRGNPVFGGVYMSVLFSKSHQCVYTKHSPEFSAVVYFQQRLSTQTNRLPGSSRSAWRATQTHLKGTEVEKKKSSCVWLRVWLLNFSRTFSDDTPPFGMIYERVNGGRSAVRSLWCLQASKWTRDTLNTAGGATVAHPCPRCLVPHPRCQDPDSAYLCLGVSA